MSKITNAILNSLRIKKLNEDINEDSFKTTVDKIISDLVKSNYDPEYYPDYHDVDAVEKNTALIQEIIDSRDPIGTFDEYLFTAYEETESDINWDTIHNVYDRLRQEDEDLPEWIELDYDLQDYIRDQVYERIPAYVNGQKILKQAQFKLDVLLKDEIGNWNEAVTTDEDDKITDISENLTKLLKIFGYSKEQFISFINDKGTDKFLKSLEEELKDSDDDNSFVFTATVSLEDVIDIKENGFVQIKEGCNCGLFDYHVGAGSSLNMEAPKNLEIKLSEVELYCDEELHYGINETYGLVDSFWKKEFIA